MKQILSTFALLGVMIGGAIILRGSIDVQPQDVTSQPRDHEVINITTTIYDDRGQMVYQGIVGDIGGSDTPETSIEFGLPQGKGRELGVQVDSKVALGTTLTAVFTDSEKKNSTTTIASRAYSKDGQTALPRVLIPDSSIYLKVIASKDNWPTK